jgi:hypothetical protein
MRIVRSLVAGGLAGAALLAFVGPADAITGPVDIRVEHDLPDDVNSVGPRVLEVTGVAPAAGPEITVADETENPSGWGGNVLVDIDPDADTITVEVEDQNCYDTVLVEITTDEVGAVTTDSDDLFAPGEEVTLTTSVAGGVVTLSWVSVNGDCPELGTEGAQAVFSYELAGPAEPAASLSPAAVQVGDPVTVTGDQCPNSPALVTITPEGGGDPIVTEDEVLGDPQGNWTYEIDTTDLAPGTYLVESRCVLADGAGFDYEELSFVVSAAPVPAVPTPAAPDFTG